MHTTALTTDVADHHNTAVTLTQAATTDLRTTPVEFAHHATLPQRSIAAAAQSESTEVTSRTALQAAARQITNQRAALASAGVQIQTVAVDTQQQRLVVGVQPGHGSTPERLLHKRFPDVPITVRYVRVVSAAGVGPYMAGPPWVTGMELYKLFYSGGRLYYTECTAGFNVVSPSTGRAYVTTAAHCFNNGDTVLHSTGYTAQQVGTVTARSGYGSSADVELVAAARGTTPNTIVIGGSELRVSSYLPVTPAGSSVCKYGITTAQVCGNIVQSTSATVCYRSGCFYDQEQTYNAKVGEVAYYGDSGGPVYVDNGNSVIAAGSVSGFEETCNAAGGGCRLDGVMFFTPIRNLQQTLGVLP